MDSYQDGLPASSEVSPLVLPHDAKGEAGIEVGHVTADLSSFIPFPNQQAVPNLTSKYQCILQNMILKYVSTCVTLVSIKFQEIFPGDFTMFFQTGPPTSPHSISDPSGENSR